MGPRAHCVHATDGRLYAQWAFGWAPRFGLYAWDHTDPEQVRHGPAISVLSCCVNNLHGVFILLAVADLPLSAQRIEYLVFFLSEEVCVTISLAHHQKVNVDNQTGLFKVRNHCPS